jgi:hypothetical protein
MEKEETVFGFFRENIRNWLVKECLESCSNPEMFWWALQEVFHDLEEEIENNPFFWDEQVF